MNKVKMKAKEWAKNAVTFFGIVGLVLGGAAAAAFVVVAAVALSVAKTFAVSALQAAVIWLAWTYSGFGLLFVTLPVELQQLSFLNALCGVVIVRVILVVIRRALNPKPNASLIADLVESAKKGKGVTA